MRPATFRRSLHSVAPATLAITAVLFLCIWLSLGTSAPSALAETASLSVQVDSSLSLVGQPVNFTISGQVSQSLAGAILEVSLLGPVAAEQVGLQTVDARTARKLTRLLGVEAGAGPASGSAGAAASGPGAGNQSDLVAGRLDVTVAVPVTSLSAPGAYVAVVQVRAGTEVLATGRAWLGKAAVRDTPLDVSFVLPVVLGVHRDWTGKFFDQVLEKATLPVESGVETIRGLVPLVDALPQWKLTISPEPFLLTQLRDMADGYISTGGTGEETNINKNDLEAQNAAAAVADMANVAGRESVEVVVSPYTGADLDLLAAEGWRDGLEQVQMGKQELQSTLGLSTPLVGAYVPDLAISGGGLGFYAFASVDHVVVGSGMVGSLTEGVAPGTVAVRAENSQNDRVTLVFASSGIAATLQSPWDPNVFSAALAAEVAANSPSALVIAPRDLYGLMPLAYVREIGRILTGQSWIRTQKLQELVSLHSPDSRPVSLAAASAQPDGYIASELLDSVRAAHVPVSDLAAAADTTKAAVDLSYQLLYVAESRWWSREAVSPAEASMGLGYAQQAKAAAREELAKVRVAKVGSPLITDGDGEIKLTLDNSTSYKVAAELQLSGQGVTFPDGEKVQLDLEPGRTEVRVKVSSESGPHRVAGALMIGTTEVDEFTLSARFIGLWGILSWVLAVVGVLAVGAAYFFVRRLRKRRSEDPEQASAEAKPRGWADPGDAPLT